MKNEIGRGSTTPTGNIPFDFREVSGYAEQESSCLKDKTLLKHSTFGPWLFEEQQVIL